MCYASKDNFIKHTAREAADILALLHQESFSSYWNKEEFSSLLSVYGTQILLAGDAEIQGALVWRLTLEQSEILTMMVRPNLRRKGIGQGLLLRALAAATAGGATRMFLEVAEDNLAARHMYEKAGFSIISCRKAYYRQYDGTFTDALVMACQLVPCA